MTPRIPKILFIFLLLISSAPGQKSIKFHHLTVKEGLSQGSVICILQDRQGLMWFGTQDGLNRYDGYNTTVYKNDPDDSSSLPDNFIITLAEDSSGRLWVGTLNSPGLLNRFDPVTETFKRISHVEVNLSGAHINAARSQYQDRSGIWWYGLRDGGLKRVDSLSGKTTIYKHDPLDPGSLSNDNVFQVAEDQTGSLWITTSGGLNKFERRSGIFTHFRHQDNNLNSINDDETWPILIDRQGIVWIGSFKRGLNRFDPKTNSFKHYRHLESDPYSLAGDRLYSLYQDRSGVIWIGTGDNGLDRFHPELAAFDHYFYEPDRRDGLIDDNISSLTVDRKGSLWIGSRRGLTRYDRKNNTFASYRHDNKNLESIPDDVVQALLTDRAGVLWVGTANSGLCRMNDNDGSFTHFRHDPKNPSGLSEDGVYALCEDRSGDIWIGTYSGGLNLYQQKSKTFKLFRNDPADAKSLSADGVWSMLIDKEGALWVGTYEGGLDRYDPGTKTFIHHRHDASDPGTISDNIVLSIYEDQTGALWIGTNNGLNRFDRETGRFARYFEKDGLPNNVIFGIMEDESGNLWMSTNKGISKLDAKSKTFTNYDVSDGLQGNEFNQGAYAKDLKSGEMFFGGANGLNAFYPGDVKSNLYLPPVIISSAFRYNTDDVEGRPIQERGASVKDTLVVSYKDNILSFEFAALNYNNSSKNQYSYRLEGFNENWINLGRDRRATFTNLDGGEYLLRVRGSNDDGIWNNDGAMLNLIVTPPWWKTRWAYGSYIILFLVFLYLTRRFEINRQMQKARMRESELHAKAIEAENRVLEIENERKTKELDDARQLQLSMLPKELPQSREYEIAVFMKTATEVGGDYYDFTLSPEGNLTLAIGDATGHGMQAGTIVTLVKGLFVSDAARFEIDEFFNHCNKAIKSIRLGRLFMALTVAKFVGNNVYLTSAGMPPAFLHRKGSGAIDEILMKAVPLGAMKNYNYTMHETAMDEGDTILFLTDGLPEQKNINQEMFDYQRLVECFKNAVASKPDEIISKMTDEIDKWMAGVQLDDDITLLVIRRKFSVPEDHDK